MSKEYNVFDAIKDTVLHPTSCWATDVQQEERKAICRECPMKTQMNTCSRCGCFIPAKVKYKDSKCPMGKW